jgi:hypothetical protein
MKIKYVRFILSTLFLIGVLLIFSSASSADDVIQSKRTLKRWVDPVIMEGRIAREIVGSPLSNVRLYAYSDGAFKPIPYQIDEMTGENGDWILTGGPIKSTDLSNGKFDTWDKLLFMAEDLGDKVSKDAWVTGYSKASEIEVTDPLTGEKGWCYFLAFSSNPPAKSSEPPYVTYDYSTETFASDTWGSQYLITKEGYHTVFYTKKWCTKKAGGNGENFLDRLTARITVTVFGVGKVRLNEEDVKSNTIGYHIGPIRLNRRCEEFVQVLNIPAIRVIEDVIYYRYGATVPLQFDIPLSNMKKLGISMVIRFGSDYNPSVIGSKCYSSTNPKGFDVDGKMDDGEENFNPEFDNWRLITGDFGTFITRTMLTPEIRQNVRIKMGIIDDINSDHSPEKYPGCIGFVWQDWDFSYAKKGSHRMFCEFYHPPHPYKKGYDEIQYVNYIDNPLKIKSENQEGKNLGLFMTKLEKRYDRHWSLKAIEEHLKKNPL